MPTARTKKRVPIPLHADEGPSWIAIIVTAVIQLWPVTAILGFLKVRALWKKKRLSTYRTYMGVVGARAHISLKKIATAVGQSRDSVVHVLGEMIQNGYLGPDAYIDYSVGYLVLEPAQSFSMDEQEEYETEARSGQRVRADIDIDLSDLKDVVGEITRNIKSEFSSSFKNAQRVGQTPYAPSQPQKEQAEEPKPQPAPEKESDHDAILKKLKALNDQILDEGVSEKIDRIGELTSDIYEFIEQNPDRANQVRKFMNYYLPTTVKLLTSYSMLERQSYQGENIVASRKNIEDILSTLVHAFEKQLDQLFAAEAIDISSDIQVLETMIAKDGLTQQAMQLKL